MSDHIDSERMSTLLDEGVTGGRPAAHLEECAACRRELELMRRTRMALSALDDLEPPEGQWEAIEATLTRRGMVRGSSGDAGAGPGDASRNGRADPDGTGAWGREAGGPTGGVWARVVAGGGWARAAAAILLFAGGVGAGMSLGGPAGSPDRAAASRDGLPARASGEPDAEAGQRQPPGLTAADEGASLSSEAGYRRALDRLEALRSQGPSPEEVYRNPEAAAEHLARLDALIRASREALRDDPADPAVNDFLFQVVEERQELNQALHLASLEYK